MYNIFISNMLQNSDDLVIANYYWKIYYYWSLLATCQQQTVGHILTLIEPMFPFGIP